MNGNQVVPVTLLAGFLGSGKTTLLNHILQRNHGRRIAVIENEFGEVNVDPEFVIGGDRDLFEMSNGCICCSIKGDLIQTLNRLLERRDRFDYILIEATGLASPGPIAQAFLVEDEIDRTLKLDGVVTLVDARHIWNHLEEIEVASEQIAFSNVILLNKADLVTREELDRLERHVRTLNPAARIHATRNAEVELDQILDIGGFDLDNVLDAAGHLKHESPGEPHAHSHPEEIGAVTLELDGYIDPDQLAHWLRMLFILEGMDVFRAKGILNVKGSDRRYLFQSVYMMFDGRFDRLWGAEPRKNKLVLIGRHLNRDRLEQGLIDACLV